MIFSHSLVILFFPAVVSPPVRERWRSFSPGSCPRSWAVCCSCWHRSRWNLWAGGRRASRHPARPSSRPWSAWCCRPSSNRPAPHRRTAPGCWRWWSFSAGAAARSSTSSWSTAAAGTRCLTEEKQIEAARKQKGSLCVVHVAMWRTCYVDVLRLVLGGEIKSRSRILVVHEAESGRKEHDIYTLLQLRQNIWSGRLHCHPKSKDYHGVICVPHSWLCDFEHRNVFLRGHKWDVTEKATQRNV